MFSRRGIPGSGSRGSRPSLQHAAHLDEELRSLRPSMLQKNDPRPTPVSFQGEGTVHSSLGIVEEPPPRIDEEPAGRPRK